MNRIFSNYLNQRKLMSMNLIIILTNGPTLSNVSLLVIRSLKHVNGCKLSVLWINFKKVDKHPRTGIKNWFKGNIFSWETHCISRFTSDKVLEQLHNIFPRQFSYEFRLSNNNSSLWVLSNWFSTVFATGQDKHVNLSLLFRKCNYKKELNSVTTVSPKKTIGSLSFVFPVG